MVNVIGRGLTKSVISSHTVYNPLTRSPLKGFPNSTRKSRTGRSLGDFMSRGFSRPIMSRSFVMMKLIVVVMPMGALRLSKSLSSYERSMAQKRRYVESHK
jgi:hypothetical protein